MVCPKVETFVWILWPIRLVLISSFHGMKQQGVLFSTPSLMGC